MLFKRIIIAAVFTGFISSCDYAVKKNLVGTPKPAQSEANCTVVIHKSLHPNEVNDSLNAELIETIALFDQMTTRCTEGEARAILRQEACKLGANWVNITSERFPGLMSTCYQCEAEIYFVSDSVSPYVDFQNPKEEQQVAKKRRGENLAALGWVVGFAVGFTVTLLLLQ